MKTMISSLKSKTFNTCISNTLVANYSNNLSVFKFSYTINKTNGNTSYYTCKNRSNFTKNHSNFSFYKTFSMSFSKKKMKFDPYLVLDINRKAEWAEIKKQYYKLARQYHPDLNQNDEVSIKYKY